METPIEILQEYLQVNSEIPLFKWHHSQKKADEIKDLLLGLRVSEIEMMIDFAKFSVNNCLFLGDEIYQKSGCKPTNWKEVFEEFKNQKKT